MAVAGKPLVGDALGAAMLGHLDEGDGWHVIERDDGFVEPMDAAVYFRPPADWPEDEPAALAHVSGRVLDVGAGAGRYSLELVRRGLDVVALDVSPGAIEACRRQGLTNLFVGTIDQYTDDEPFDTFVFGGHNLGLLSGPSEARHVLDAVRRLAAPGARIVGTSRDPLNTEMPEHLAYHAWNRSRGRAPGQTRMRMRYRRLTSEWIDYWFLSLDELATVSEANGWSIEHHLELSFGSYLAVLRMN